MEFPDTLNALVVARRIANRLDEDGITYGVGGALALLVAMRIASRLVAGSHA
jgi:hypothetical protein